MNIDSYIPINTKEKVDKIICDILLYHESRDIYTEVMCCIKKFKMQIYFTKQFEKIRNNLPRDNSSKGKSAINHKRTSQNRKSKYNQNVDCMKRNVLTNDSYIISIDSFIGMTVLELSEFIAIPIETLMSIIKQKDKSIDVISPQLILTDATIRKNFEFINYAYRAKIRRCKNNFLLKKEIENAKYERIKKEERTKPSLGREGNYRKLIYIPTKT